VYQYYKRQLKTPTGFGSFGIHPQGVLNVLHLNYLWCLCGSRCLAAWNLDCNMKRNVKFVRYSSKITNLDNNWWSGSGDTLWCVWLVRRVENFRTLPYKSDIPFHITVQISRCQIPTTNTNITSNFSEARLILPEDGSQRIRNMSEFLIVF